MADPRQEVLVRNQVDGVLQDYLDQLLVVATETRPQTAVAQSAPAPEIAIAEPSLPQTVIVHPQPDTELLLVDGEIQGWEVDEATEPDVAIPATEVITDDDTAQELAETSVALTSATSGLNWDSSQGIECLIFKVAGLKLAIPLPLLGGVFPVEGKVTPLIGQVKWSLGIWQCDGQKLTVIDSAQLIMPERGVALAEEGYEYLIQLDRAPWALACQEICDTVTLVNESIKWRGDLSKRPWLAGTVISEMCALLDVPGLIELAESQRKAS